MITWILFALGIPVLVAGAELLVRGASRLASAAGISPLVIGLTVVAYGTSAPELAVSLQAVLGGSFDLATGNIVGSNIANVLLILGLAATIAPLAVARQVVRLDVPVLIVTGVALVAIGLDGIVSTFDGLLLFAAGIVYTVFIIRQSRRETAAETAAEIARNLAHQDAPVPAGGPAGTQVDAPADAPAIAVAAVPAEARKEAGDPNARGLRGYLMQGALILAGLALLVLGGRWLVAGATELARIAGLSELVIGLTVVAVGTSLPEIATSLMASIRGERDIAVGNAIGSSIFNILTVLGATAIIAPEGLVISPSVMTFDLPVMIAVSIACLPIFFTGQTIDRWEGILFLGYYAAYTLYLILDAYEHDTLPAFSITMMLFVVPLTAITLAILSWRAWRAGRARRARTMPE